jgi:hypothetical protein
VCQHSRYCEWIWEIYSGAALDFSELTFFLYFPQNFCVCMCVCVCVCVCVCLCTEIADIIQNFCSRAARYISDIETLKREAASMSAALLAKEEVWKCGN